MIYLGNSLPPGSVSADAFGKRPVSHGLGSHPGIFKAYWNTNETLALHLMMNYVATQVITYRIIFWGRIQRDPTPWEPSTPPQGDGFQKLFGLEYGWNPGNRAGADPGHLHLPEVQQAGI